MFVVKMLTLTPQAIADSLTVEFSKMPGKSFHRKVLSKFTVPFCLARYSEAKFYFDNGNDR